MVVSLVSIAVPIVHFLLDPRGGMAGFARWYAVSLLSLLIGNLVAVPAAIHAFPRASRGRKWLVGLPTSVAVAALSFQILPLLGSLVTA
jgi:hypothetical protein